MADPTEYYAALDAYNETRAAVRAAKAARREAYAALNTAYTAWEESTK
jgi:hypothetical protein